MYTNIMKVDIIKLLEPEEDWKPAIANRPFTAKDQVEDEEAAESDEKDVEGNINEAFGEDEIVSSF